MDRTLRAALLKLHGQQTLPASHFTAAQRSALDRFARQTGAVICQRQGRGDVYRVSDPRLFDIHLSALSPQVGMLATGDLPLRAQHIAHARDSKARHHQHECYYPLLKAVGEKVLWRQGERGSELPLSQLTHHFGAASLCIEAGDTWQSGQPLWLVENQALFDRTDWLPVGTQATLLYYGGQLDGRLLAWLGQRPRASRTPRPTPLLQSMQTMMALLPRKNVAADASQAAGARTVVVQARATAAHRLLANKPGTL